MPRALLLVVVALAATAALALRDRWSPAPETPRERPSLATYSNVRVADYVGPEVCRECHPDRYQQWRAHQHRVMNTRVESTTAVAGDFSGVALRYGGGTARFERDERGPTMTLEHSGVARRYRITRTIGARYLQEYVGVLEAGPEPAGHPLYETEVRLPFGFWKRARRWLHQQYFDSWYGREFDDDGALRLDPYAALEEPWRERCAWCHNTYPFEYRVARLEGMNLGSGIEQFFTATDEMPLSPEAARGSLPVSNLVTVGISCESCHFGGREHAIEGEEIRFLPTSSALSPSPQAPPLTSDRSSSATVNAICAQCHSAPSPLYDSGIATRNSSEALDLASGGCRSQIRCPHCHDPHRTGRGEADAPAHVEACLGCHVAYADASRARRHSRHDDSVTCLDCHMPRVVQGISHVVRTHHIGSPTDPLVLGYGPNACNLCHLDRSLAWTLRELEGQWGARIDRDVVARGRYGDSQRAMGPTWLASDAAIDRITAADAYARSPLGRDRLDDLLAGLRDPVAYNRMRFLFAVEDILGRPLDTEEFDPMQPPDVLAESVRRLRRSELNPTPP